MIFSDCHLLISNSNIVMKTNLRFHTAISKITFYLFFVYGILTQIKNRNTMYVHNHGYHILLLTMSYFSKFGSYYYSTTIDTVLKNNL